MSHGARAPLELVTRPRWLKHLKSNSTKQLVLPTPRRENKTLTVETDENGKEVDVENAHDEVTVIEENQKQRGFQCQGRCNRRE